MTTATLSFNRVQKNLQARIDSVDMPMVNWKMICFIGFFISLVLLVFYVWQINDLTRGSYTINSYENQISHLSEGNKNLEVSFAESSFLGQALEKIQSLNFQKTTSVQYIQIPDESVAINQR
jgi:predicted PurR-regulated permease PerM